VQEGEEGIFGGGVIEPNGSEIGGVGGVVGDFGFVELVPARLNVSMPYFKCRIESARWRRTILLYPRVRVLGGLAWVGIQIPCLRIYRGSMLVIFNSETEGDGAQGIVRAIGR
jgi:hypothetical protein